MGCLSSSDNISPCGEEKMGIERMAKERKGKEGTANLALVKT